MSKPRPYTDAVTKKHLTIAVKVELSRECSFVADVPLDELCDPTLVSTLTDEQLLEHIQACALGYVVDHIQVTPTRGEARRALKVLRALKADDE